MFTYCATNVTHIFGLGGVEKRCKKAQKTPKNHHFGPF
jgi:hypothetical protein